MECQIKKDLKLLKESQMCPNNNCGLEIRL
jgi:hypothetical protein